MTAQTPADLRADQRRWKAAERQRRAAAGLKEIRGIWAYPEDEAAIKRYAQRLRAERDESEPA